MFNKKTALNFFILLILCGRPFVWLSAAAPTTLQIRAEDGSPDTSEALGVQDKQKQLDDGLPQHKALVSQKTGDNQPVEKAAPPGVLAASDPDSDPTDLPTSTTTATPPGPTPADPATTTTTADPASLTPAPSNATTSDTVATIPPVTIVTQLGDYSAVVVASAGKTSTINLPQPSGTAVPGPSKTVTVTSAGVRMSSSIVLVAASILVSFWALV